MVGQNRAALGETVEVWSLDARKALCPRILPSNACVAVAKIVSENEYDIWLVGARRGKRRASQRKNKSDSHHSLFNSLFHCRHPTIKG